jgi:hypothetical protein
MTKHTSRLLQILVLLGIFLVALVLRFHRLDDAPKGALIDEAHFGYLAKSLLETGKDEHGVSWPIVFKGFGDQKLPGYAYLMMPFVALLDLSVFSIRVPSAFLGAVSVLLIYLLAKQLGFRPWERYVAATIMALSPWPFFLSRFGFESNLALFFWLLALNGLVYAVLKKAVGRTYWAVLVGTGVALAGTWYSYIAYRPITAGVLLCLLVWAALQKRALLKPLLIMLAVLAVTVLPLFHPSVSSSNTARLKQVGLLSDEGNIRLINEYRTFCAIKWPLPACSLVWNKGTFVAQKLAERYLHTFSPQFLATYGESVERFLTVQGFGQFSLALYPLFLIGVSELLFFRKKGGDARYIILAGLFLSPLPSIIAGEPQKVRISALLPFVVIAMVYGAYRVNEWLKTLELPKVPRWAPQVVVALGVGLAFFGTTTLYFLDYFLVHTAKNDFMYQSYVRYIFPEVQRKFPDHKIFVKPFFSDPTMFYAFYTKMDPKAYQEQAVLGKLEDSGFQHTVEIDKVKVWEQGLISASCQALLTNTPTIYITNEKEDGIIPIQAISENGAMVYAYGYDGQQTAKKRIEMCNDIPLEERERIKKQVETQGIDSTIELKK